MSDSETDGTARARSTTVLMLDFCDWAHHAAPLQLDAAR